MTRHQTLTHLISKTDFIEKLLEQVAKLYYQDLQEHRTEHIMFEASSYKEGLYNIDLFIFKVVKAFLKAVDFSDVERNKKIMATFIQLFTEIRGELPDRNVGFFAIPLHRIFSYYINRLLM
jgi:hemerythrin